LLSIPLYVLCASRIRREGSLEAGLKYLIIGSLGSATLLYGLALVYGATGSTDETRTTGTPAPSAARSMTAVPASTTGSTACAAAAGAGAAGAGANSRTPIAASILR
ncbi:MAG: proton-conducting transporter membrane subunit, partial [Vitreoscilla sp.]